MYGKYSTRVGSSDKYRMKQSRVLYLPLNPILSAVFFYWFIVLCGRIISTCYSVVMDSQCDAFRQIMYVVLLQSTSHDALLNC